MSAPDRVWAGSWEHGGDVALSLAYAERVLVMQDPTEYVRAEWVLAWIKDRHLTWCRGEDRETAIGFEEWIDQQWALTSRADGDER